MSKGPDAAQELVRQLPELRAGQSVRLLQALHIVTRDGRINQDSRRKLKQVLHLVQFIEPMIQDVARKRVPVASEGQASDGALAAGPVLVDHGAGKSYLGFLLYDLVLRPLGCGEVVGVEARPELVRSSVALARELAFARMRFVAARTSDLEQAPVAALAGIGCVDIVTALHACDSATDEAIEFALAHQASHVVLVPCCQAELARQLNAGKALQLARTPLAELWRHPLHTRELGSHLTNVLRCLYLEAMGYQVRVTELVGWEHSLKNELILATRQGHSKAAAARRFHSVVADFGIMKWAETRFPRMPPTCAENPI